MRLRRLPAVMEAVQWTGRNTEEMMAYLPEIRVHANDSLLFRAGVNGVNGWTEAPIGHWIMSDPSVSFPDFWPVDDDYLKENYEEVQDVVLDNGDPYTHGVVVPL